MINPFLIAKNIYLRAPEPGDEKIVAISENHPEPREILFYAYPTSMSDQETKLQKLSTDPESVVLIICLKKSDKPIGLTYFTRIDWVGRMAVFYIAIAEPQNWSQGYGRETTALMVDYAFTTLNLNRIQLHVAVENKRAISIYESLGFKKEGTLRQAMYKRGKYYNFYVMGLLESEYRKGR